MSTIFKKIIDKQVPANILYENDHILCFKDINSVAPKHYLIIPKKEINNVNGLHNSDKMLIGEMFIGAKHIAKLLNINAISNGLLIAGVPVIKIILISSFSFFSC